MTETSVEEKRQYLELYAVYRARIDRYYALSAMNSDKKYLYKKRLAEALAVRDVIENDIEKLEDGMEREVLAQKYLCGKSFLETAQMLNYSRRQVERIHLSGLEHLNINSEMFTDLGRKRQDGTGNTTL